MRISRQRRPGNLRNRNRAAALGNRLHRRGLLLRGALLGNRELILDHIGASLGADGRNLDDVVAAQRVLRQAAVVLDELLDGVVVGDVDLEGSLDGEEGHALGAGGSGKRARVLEDVGGLDGGEDAAEVDAGFDFRLAAGLLDGGEVGGDARDDGVRGLGAELEHEG